MKLALLESLVVWVIVGTNVFNYTLSETKLPTKEPLPKTERVYRVQVPRDTLNLDSLITETKASIKLYNASEKAKLNTDKKEVSLLKTKVALSKQQLAITKEIIAKLKKKVKASNSDALIKKDSVCAETNKGLNRVFSGKKCLRYDVTYYIEVDNKRYNLNKD